MLTRSQAKLQQQSQFDKPKQTVASKPVIVKRKQAIEKKNSVRLTEDLLYIVNNKVRAMDKETRDDILQNFENHRLARWMDPVIGPFTEIAYRKQNLDLSQTELAVMHKVNFDCNSTAVCKLNSMGQFFHNIERARQYARSLDYGRFLHFQQRTAEAQVENPVARFMQLPKDYYRPHSDCSFFGELAWKENGVMTVEADNFALCLSIWTLKEWLANPIDNSYPLSCRFYRGYYCCGRNLLRAMWTDDRLQAFLKDKAILDEIEIFDPQDDEENDPESLQANYDELKRAHREMGDFATKLVTGEETISRSIRSLNVLAASQLERMLEKFETHIFKCCEYKLLQMERMKDPFYELSDGYSDYGYNDYASFEL